MKTAVLNTLVATVGEVLSNSCQIIAVTNDFPKHNDVDRMLDVYHFHYMTKIRLPNTLLILKPQVQLTNIRHGLSKSIANMDKIII